MFSDQKDLKQSLISREQKKEIKQDETKSLSLTEQMQLLQTTIDVADEKIDEEFKNESRTVNACQHLDPKLCVCLFFLMPLFGSAGLSIAVFEIMLAADEESNAMLASGSVGVIGMLLIWLSAAWFSLNRFRRNAMNRPVQSEHISPEIQERLQNIITQHEETERKTDSVELQTIVIHSEKDEVKVAQETKNETPKTLGELKQEYSGTIKKIKTTQKNAPALSGLLKDLSLFSETRIPNIIVDYVYPVQSVSVLR